MTCVVCHSGETCLGTTTVTFHRDGRTVVITEVPADVCENCSEAYVAENVTARLLELVTQAREANIALLIRDYEPAAA